MPGFDIAWGLRHAGANRGLYLDLLRRFHQEYGDATGRLRHAISAGDPEGTLLLAGQDGPCQHLLSDLHRLQAVPKR